MLKLDNIVKNYYVAGETVQALKNITINFRENEFVSVLGPSGCGKTTLLNIIGGLDKYTSGDLFIDGKSTKDFKDHDWDVYRNHRIGFVFQSYNLIPHQTILGNVELALTISGMSKEERISKAKLALDTVGLKGQYKKKPNQLSGGQCQRVAIARALVNEPDILLADEPTGALDTVTSVQIMDLIKEISKDRLVIMVTHNPDLANKYSTRIINLLDGNIIDDSNPYDGKIEKQKEKSEEKIKKEKAKMSFFTALRLSFRNLFSKLKRTIMVVIAGSIGIIGVSSVLSVSTGIKDYIAGMQDDLLSGNPITITKSGIDYESVLSSSTLLEKAEAVLYDDAININSIISYLVKHEDSLQELVYSNEFSQDYINYLLSMPDDYYQSISLRYSLTLTPSIYTDFKVYKNTDSKNDGKISLNAIRDTYNAVLQATDYGQYSSYITALATVLKESVATNDYIKTQYDLLAGHLPEKSTDIIVVLDKNHSLSDLLLTQLGYLTEDEFFNLIFKEEASSLSGNYDPDLYVDHLSYEDILNKKFYWYPNDLIYQDESTIIGGKFSHLYNYSYKVPEDDSWKDKEVELNICGIVCPKDNISYGSLSSGFFYTEEFARYVISQNIHSQISKNIMAYGTINNGNVSLTMTNPLTGKDMKIDINQGVRYQLDYTYYDTTNEKFKDADETKQFYVGASQSGIANTFLSYIGSSLGGLGSALSGLDLGSFNLSSLGLANVGGTYVPNSISIYPNDFATKYLVTDYLDAWNDENKTVTFYDFKEDLSDLGDSNVEKVSLSFEDRVFVKNRNIEINLDPNVWEGDYKYAISLTNLTSNKDIRWHELTKDENGFYSYVLTENEYNTYKYATFYKFDKNEVITQETKAENAIDKTKRFEFTSKSDKTTDIESLDGKYLRIDELGDEENLATGSLLNTAKTIYLNANVWEVPSVPTRYAIYLDNGTDVVWYDMEKKDGERFYSATLSHEDMNKFTYLGFVRFNLSEETNDLNKALNKVLNLAIPTDIYAEYSTFKVSYFGSPTEDSLGSWNRTALTKIKYTDQVELIIDMINQMIDIVTYALVVFTSLALVVSTVMVGIITYVSVMERVKEIGVIRSLGGRKHDVSNLFYAETFMIGFSSGVFGVLITGLLCIIGNLIISIVSEGTVKTIAHLTWTNALSMILISIALTSLSGILPAKSAARKDPVVALRTE